MISRCWEGEVMDVLLTIILPAIIIILIVVLTIFIRKKPNFKSKGVLSSVNSDPITSKVAMHN